MKLFGRGILKSEKRADSLESDVIDESSFKDVLLSAILPDENITKEQAMQIPAVASCISAIAGVIAGLPIKLYKQSEDKTEIQRWDNRLFLLNKDTGDTLTLTQFWRAMLSDYFLSNGGYAYIRREYSTPRSLHYVKRSSVNILHNSDHIFKDYMVMVDGQKYQRFDFFKLLRNTENGWSSKSIMEENGVALAAAYREYVFENSLASKGGNKKGFVTSQFQLSKEQVKSIKDGFRGLFGNGKENTVILPKGTDFKESSQSSVEMQLNENKQTNAELIASIFHVPLSVAKGKTTKENYDSFIKLAVMPVINDIEKELNRVFLLESEKDTFYFAFDTTNLTRGSVKERYEAYKQGLDANFLQIDEVRDMEDLPPMGIDFIKLGLDAVLYNPETKEAYTPNMDVLSNVGGSRKEVKEENEDRG